MTGLHVQGSVTIEIGLRVAAISNGSVSGSYQLLRFDAPHLLEIPMAIDYHLLSSLSATLDDVVRRLGEVARSADDENDPVIDLLEVERQLTTASRRLAKISRPR